MSLLRRPHDHHRSFRWSALPPVSRPQTRRLIARKSRDPPIQQKPAMPPHRWRRPRSAQAVLRCSFLALSIQQNHHRADHAACKRPPCTCSCRPSTHSFRASPQRGGRYPDQISIGSNSWPAVQCNEGFRNASEGQRLPLTTTMASQKPHHCAKLRALSRADDGAAASQRR